MNKPQVKTWKAPSSVKEYPLGATCPSDHLTSINAAWRTYRPVINQEKCVMCLRCFLVCPDGVIDKSGDQLEIAGLWVLPNTMGKGVGRQLIEAALSHCRSEGVAVLRLLSDPNAQGFYEAMGAELIGYERGSRKGRLLPLMHLGSGLNED